MNNRPLATFHKGVPLGLFDYNNKKRRKKTTYLSSTTNPFLVIIAFTLAKASIFCLQAMLLSKEHDRKNNKNKWGMKSSMV